jgi:hypothetical protein
MKLQLLVSSGLLALSSAAAVQSTQKKSYDGYKVFRVSVGSDLAKINSIVDKLGLQTWKGKPKANAPADIVVPPSQLKAFEAGIAGLTAVTMHENLGAAIDDESSFSAYAGI